MTLRRSQMELLHQIVEGFVIREQETSHLEEDDTVQEAMNLSVMLGYARYYKKLTITIVEDD